MGAAIFDRSFNNARTLAHTQCVTKCKTDQWTHRFKSRFRLLAIFIAIYTTFGAFDENITREKSCSFHDDWTDFWPSLCRISFPSTSNRISNGFQFVQVLRSSTLCAFVIIFSLVSQRSLANVWHLLGLNVFCVDRFIVFSAVFVREISMACTFRFHDFSFKAIKLIAHFNFVRFQLIGRILLIEYICSRQFTQLLWLFDSSWNVDLLRCSFSILILSNQRACREQYNELRY